MRTGVTALLVAWLAGSAAAQPDGNPIDELFRSQADRFGPPAAYPARHRVQILYTRIGRDADNRPSFESFRYRVDPGEYFYPASTVKLPVAALALEKLNRLDLDPGTPMLTGSAAAFQTVAEADPTAPGGLPSVAHYVRKILLVSDNDAFNRLYEFLGQQTINEALAAKGYAHTRIVHRLEVALTPAQNRATNPVRFVDRGRTVYEQPPVVGSRSYLGEVPVLLGEAEIVEGVRREGPKDFAEKNAYALQDLHDTLVAILFPDSVPERRRFELGSDDYAQLYRYMSAYPGESGIEAYSDAAVYPPGYVKFLLFGGDAPDIPPGIRVFNKIGDAYGFLTDAAYVVDFERGVEFILVATVYANANATFNDDRYEYDEIGLPFLRELGKAVYEIELARERTRRPDLSRFRLSGRDY